MCVLCLPPTCHTNSPTDTYWLMTNPVLLTPSLWMWSCFADIFASRSRHFISPRNVKWTHDAVVLCMFVIITHRFNACMWGCIPPFMPSNPHKTKNKKKTSCNPKLQYQHSPANQFLNIGKTCTTWAAWKPGIPLKMYIIKVPNLPGASL